MLTQENLQRLKDMVDQQAGPQQAELKAALEDLQKAIAGEALLIRNLLIQLRNAQVGNMAIQNVLTETTLSDIFNSLHSPKRNPFSVAEADAAVRELSDKVANANNFADVLATVVKVAKVFI